VAFWNVAGLGNKMGDFWSKLRDWDVMVLVETWEEEKNWERIKERLPRGYEWRMQAAKRRNKKGRTTGGMILRIRKELMEKEEGERREVESVISGKIKYGKGSLRIVEVRK